MSGYAPLLADLSLVALVLGLALGLTLGALSLFAGRASFALRAALATLGLGGLYALVLVAVALASRELVLPAGAEKYVSGFDPHLHYAVEGPAEHDSAGLVIPVRLWSDASRAIQDPRVLAVALVDAHGRVWPALAPEGGAPSHPFTRRLAPRESYVARVRFRPAPDARGLRLLVRETGFPTVLSIGHENSPFHRRTFQAVDGL